MTRSSSLMYPSQNRAEPGCNGPNRGAHVSGRSLKKMAIIDSHWDWKTRNDVPRPHGITVPPGRGESPHASRGSLWCMVRGNAAMTEFNRKEERSRGIGTFEMVANRLSSMH